MTEPIHVSTRTVHPAVILDLQGLINSQAQPALLAAFEQAAAGQPAAVILNFAQVQYINSTGIAIIVEMLARARKRGLTVLAFGLSEHYVEIFEITRLAEFVQICPDEAAALAAMG